jgi:hypothetical protein
VRTVIDAIRLDGAERRLVAHREGFASGIPAEDVVDSLPQESRFRKDRGVVDEIFGARRDIGDMPARLPGERCRTMEGDP